MLKIKHVLNDLVDCTYPDSDKKDEYKRFYVEMIDKNMKTRHGDYNGMNHHIRIFNLYREDAAVIATTVHELTHHIDFINRGFTDHSKEFYEVFQVLLYKALDMGIFSKEEFMNANRDASDSNKIAKMLKDYEPEDTGYKKDLRNIEVRNGYDKKTLLKERGYHWNGINKVWEKEVALNELESETTFLQSESLEYSVNEATNLSFRKKSYIVAGKGSYEVRDELKADGFRYDKNTKSWKKEGTQDEIPLYVKKYPEVVFKTM